MTPPEDAEILTKGRQMGVSQNYGYHLGGPHNNDYGIFGGLYWKSTEKVTNGKALQRAAGLKQEEEEERSLW